MKSQIAAGTRLPDPAKGGTVFVSVKNADKEALIPLVRMLHDMGYKLVATRGTASVISAQGLPVGVVNKVTEGRPHVVDMIKNGEICFIINTVEEKRTAMADSRSIRTTGLAQRVTTYTTLAGARAAVEGMGGMANSRLEVYDLQSLHRSLLKDHA